MEQLELFTFLFGMAIVAILTIQLIIDEREV